MAIPLVHEDDLDMSFQQAFGVDRLVEACFFCKAPSRFWHHKSNEPVCPGCAQKHTVAELPTTFRPVKNEATPKPLEQAEIEFRAENDRIQAELDNALKQVRHLTNQKRTLHRRMVEAKMTIKNPIE